MNRLLKLLPLAFAATCLAQSQAARRPVPAPSAAEVRLAAESDFEAMENRLAATTDAVTAQQAEAPEDPLTAMRTEYAYTAYGKPAKFPLTSRDKFNLFFRDGYDPFNLVGEAGQAAYNQAMGSPSDYGGGAVGYAKRFGAIVGTDYTGEFFGTWLFPSMLGTDPRYFRMARGPYAKRAVYALTRILITKKDSGGNTFNAANFLGGFATTSISNLYYPHRNRDLRPTLEHATINIGFDALSNLFREFWPDFAHAIRIPAWAVRRTVDPVFPKKQSATDY